MPMKEEELKKFEALLLAKKRDMLKEMGVIGETHKDTIKESTGDLSHYSYHMADQGTDNMEREMAFAYASKGGRLVYHIDQALKRIKDGTYGKCHVCGKQIKRSRLKAVPHARMCIQCKSEEEVKNTGRK